jgi:hypothetical protein
MSEAAATQSPQSVLDLWRPPSDLAEIDWNDSAESAPAAVAVLVLIFAIKFAVREMP